jgi:hypothetical protein
MKFQYYPNNFSLFHMIFLLITQIMQAVGQAAPGGSAAPDPNAQGSAPGAGGGSNNLPEKNKVTIIVFAAVGGGIVFIVIAVYAIRKIFLKVFEFVQLRSHGFKPDYD